MNLIQRIKNWFFKSITKEVVKELQKKPNPTAENIRLQALEDRKWESRVRQKATQRYMELTARKSGVPILDVTRYNDTYVIYDEDTAMFKHGIEQAIRERLSKMLALKDTVPKNTVPRV